MRRTLAILVTAFAAVAATISGTASAAKPFPSVIPLPNGWLPEGIAIGKGTTFYSGSRANGAIYRGDVRTGKGAIWVPGQSGGIAVGLALDRSAKYLFVAGGTTGKGNVYATGSGNPVASFTLTAPGNFVNDVIVTKDAAYFTNSDLPSIHRVPLGNGGKVDPRAAPQTITLGGHW